jgi:glycosyltransferase involved in cell wall biosynthesis
MIPGTDSSAGERRLVRMAAMLAERATVDLVATGTARPTDESARIDALQATGGAGAVRVPYGGRPVHLARLLRGPRYELILAEGWEIAEQVLPLVRRHQTEAALAVDTVDLHFLRNARAATVLGVSHPGHERTMARELRTYHAADIRIFVSEVERELYGSFPDSRADHNPVIPIIVDETSVARTPRRGEVAFVGGLWHAPNMDGVLWFCSDVWPRVRECLPDAQLRLFGSNAWSVPIDTTRLAACLGVAVEGYVADLGAVYAGTGAVVAPVRFGAGMKGKVCEAMAAGVPVVTTSVGVEGIRALPGRDLLVADDPAAFAHAVVSLLGNDDLAASVGAAGSAAIRAQCGADVVRPAVHGLLRGLRPARRSMTPALRGGEAPRRAAAAWWRLGRRLHARYQRAQSQRG